MKHANAGYGGSRPGACVLNEPRNLAVLLRKRDVLTANLLFSRQTRRLAVIAGGGPLSLTSRFVVALGRTQQFSIFPAHSLPTGRGPIIPFDGSSTMDGLRDLEVGLSLLKLLGSTAFQTTLYVADTPRDKANRVLRDLWSRCEG